MKKVAELMVKAIACFQLDGVPNKIVAEERAIATGQSGNVIYTSISGHVGEWGPGCDVEVSVEWRRLSEEDHYAQPDARVTANWSAPGAKGPAELVLLAELHRRVALAACQADAILRDIPEVQFSDCVAFKEAEWEARKR